MYYKVIKMVIGTLVLLTIYRSALQMHDSDGVAITKGRGPFKLIYYEACLNQQDAYTREKYLKSGMGKRYIKNRLKRFLFLTG